MCSTQPWRFHYVHREVPRAHCLLGSRHGLSTLGYPCRVTALWKIHPGICPLAKPRGSELVAPRELLKWMWPEKWGRAGGTLTRWEEGGVIRGATAAPVGNCPLEAGRLASRQ